MVMPRSILVSLLPLLMAMTPASRLDVDHEPFLEDFRAADGRVRLVTLLSPT